MRRIMPSHPDYELINLTQHYLCASLNPSVHFDITAELNSGTLEDWKIKVAVNGIFDNLCDLIDEPLDTDVWAFIDDL
jgi:hypothetical protein